MTQSHSSSYGDKIKFFTERSQSFMETTETVVANNPWIKYVVSVDLEDTMANTTMEQAIDHSEVVARWVKANAEGRFVRVGFSRAYGFELDSDIVLFHLTWGKG